MKNLPKIAKVLLDLSLDRSFDYAVPPAIAGEIRVGMHVMVPFGKGAERAAFVVGFAETSPFPNLKAICSICQDNTSLPDSLIRLSEWMADYYCCARETAIRNLLPGAVRSGKVKQKTETWYFPADRDTVNRYMLDNPKAQGRCALLKVLLRNTRGMSAEQLLREAGCSMGVLKKLVSEKVVVTEERGVDRDPFKGADVLPTQPKEPSPEQAAALELIRHKLHDRKPEESHVVLLHGVTGSGKTEVYLQTIAEVLKAGGEAIVLVPEISLTPQTVERFRARFGDQLSVLHSGLSDGERYDEWMKVQNGRVKIAVGARSALFAPFRHLALIVVDEEQFLQAVRSAALQCARHRGGPGQVRKRAGDPGIRHAVGRILLQRRDRQICAGEADAAARSLHPDARGDDHRHASGIRRRGTHPVLFQGADRCRLGPDQARRTEHHLPEPPRLCPPAELSRLRLYRHVPGMFRGADLSQTQ